MTTFPRSESPEETWPKHIELCPRTLALWRPGEKMAGVHHTFSWSGHVPNTGVLRCTLCGKVKS